MITSEKLQLTDVFLQFVDEAFPSVGSATVGREPGDVSRLSGLDVARSAVWQTAGVVREVRKPLVRSDERRVQAVRRRPVHLHANYRSAALSKDKGL